MPRELIVRSAQPTLEGMPASPTCPASACVFLEPLRCRAQTALAHTSTACHPSCPSQGALNRRLTHCLPCFALRRSWPCTGGACDEEHCIKDEDCIVHLIRSARLLALPCSPKAPDRARRVPCMCITLPPARPVCSPGSHSTWHHQARSSEQLVRRRCADTHSTKGAAAASFSLIRIVSGSRCRRCTEVK